jgi:hypothetical protein
VTSFGLLRATVSRPRLREVFLYAGCECAHIASDILDHFVGAGDLDVFIQRIVTPASAGTAGDRFGASLPKSAVSAFWKSPVDTPRR